MPKVILNSKPFRLRTQIASIQDNLPEVCNDSRLTSIVCSSLETMIASEQPGITYKRFHYFRQFVMDLRKYCFTAKPFSMPITDFLIRKNFNEPAFIDHLIQELRDQITDDMSLQEQAEKWAFHVKEFNQIIIAASSSLHPSRPSVKEYLTSAAEQELSFLKQKISLLPAVSITALPGDRGKRSVATDLTVSQLGVFMRLLVDCRLIQHTNQTELLKLIAGCVTTTKTAQVSAESLRVRYYNPDRASIAITKEYLLQMMKQLNEY